MFPDDEEIIAQSSLNSFEVARSHLGRFVSRLIFITLSLDVKEQAQNLEFDCFPSVCLSVG